MQTKITADADLEGLEDVLKAKSGAGELAGVKQQKESWDQGRLTLANLLAGENYETGNFFHRYLPALVVVSSLFVS